MPTRGQERRNGKESIGATMIMFEIMFLVIAVIALLRLPKDVRRMPERRPSASPVEPGIKCAATQSVARHARYHLLLRSN
jgi:hypothetical protein